MPDFLRARIITRDISMFPHRDLENIPLVTDLELWWGDKPVPSGYVTVIDLGEQKLDFGGGIDLRHRSADSYDTSLNTIESSLSGRSGPRRSGRRAARKKTTRKKAKAKRGAGRPRGS
jgi:hypothetical protein